MKKLFAALLLVSAPLAAQPSPQPMPAWLAGAWAMEEGLEWADEFWTPPRGEMMIGAGRMGAGRQVQSWESMRIQRKADGSLSFFAQPRGAPATEFPLVNAGDEMVEFANGANDFPQRIRYWRQGQLLMAEIARLDGSGAVRFNFRPMAQ